MHLSPLNTLMDNLGSKYSKIEYSINKKLSRSAILVDCQETVVIWCVLSIVSLSYPNNLRSML